MSVLRTVEDARNLSRYNNDQWERFYRITLAQAKAISKDHPEWNWPDVPYPVKGSVREKVNSQLKAEGIPTLRGEKERILSWRMKSLMREARRSARQSPGQTPSVTSSGAASEPARRYDPIRDL